MQFSIVVAALPGAENGCVLLRPMSYDFRVLERLQVTAHEQREKTAQPCNHRAT
jgi:hypothetical protein